MAKSVLVVDDEPNIVLSLEFLLNQAGFETRVARDGDAALKAVRESAPDLVLLDVMTPGRDGYDVCQTIRDNPAWNHVKIIMLTARSREVEQEKGLARISQTTMDEGVCGGAGDVVGRTSFSDSGIKHVADDQDRTGAWQQRWWGLCELCGVWFVSVQRRQ